MSNKIDFKGLFAHALEKQFTAVFHQSKGRDAVLEPEVEDQGPLLYMHSKVKIIQSPGV